MRPITLTFILILTAFTSVCQKVKGIITDTEGKALPYASISIKGTSKGTNANSTGHYNLTLSPGKHTLICQYVNYKREEKTVTVTGPETELNFTLVIQELTLGEVIIKKGEDPAYEIIRKAIKKRSYYNNQVDSFTVDVYIKGLLRSRGMPARVFGKKIERNDSEGLDSAGKGILFLSESVTSVSFKKPDKIKYRVISSRVSGSSGGFGLSFPFFINFYQNNVNVFENTLNPRGFISPIADGALNYYKYKYEGSFVEDNKMVNTIKVIPRRKNEPLFSGTIQIIEDDWRIYSLDLKTTRDYSLELADTLRVSQLHASISGDIWKTKSQVVYVTVKMMGFDFAGNFVNVYTDYDLTPGFTKKYFDRILMKYDTAFNKKDSIYWNTARPVTLEQDEKRDFVFKDSVAKVNRDSFLTRRNIDSLRRYRKPITVKNFLWSGVNYNFYGTRMTVNYTARPLVLTTDYNTVEGLAPRFEQSFRFNGRKAARVYTLDLNARYGFSNKHFNSYAELTSKPRKDNYRNRYYKLSGGKRVSQFNHESPVEPVFNSISTLLYHRNYMKIYENWFGGVEYNTRTESGFRINFHATYEDRLPLKNTTDYSFVKGVKPFLPNHPYELEGIPFQRHQAVVVGTRLSWQPGQRYIQFPTYKVPISSRYPTFGLEYNKGIEKLAGSDVDFDKWKFSLSDDINLKLRGEFRYKISIGGFLNKDKVEIPDYQHFNGNQVYYINKYLDAFQMAPYYRYSNTEDLYAVLHVEHHFNGFLTNKIPLFNKLKWYLVAGVNSFYVNDEKYYAEAFAGFENIFKIFRVDFINAYQPGLNYKFGVKVGAGGLIGGKIRIKR